MTINAKKHKYKHKRIYAQRNGPSEIKPNPENCKNCSSKCAYDCAQLWYTAVQHRTVLIIFPLTSRQSSHFKCCLLEEKGVEFNNRLHGTVHSETANASVCRFRLTEIGRNMQPSDTFPWLQIHQECVCRREHIFWCI